MRKVENLSRDELISIANALQGCLYLTDNFVEAYWDPKKEWEVGMFETLADVLGEFDLVPQRRMPVE